MPATFITKEPFPKETPDQSLKEGIRLRVKAGAIRSWIETTDTQKILCTEWNVLGENDD